MGFDRRWMTAITELPNPMPSPIVFLMNAAEIIEEIQRLPPEEMGKVVEFMRHVPNAETLEAMNEARYPEKLEKFDSAADMFEKSGLQC